ncbi:hypothetical protein CSPX01_04665 [Colletotrichum filicis]|nr:hypothetical protein CSPX01_04665 [Colletotrichum filicis]
MQRSPHSTHKKRTIQGLERSIQVSHSPKIQSSLPHIPLAPIPSGPLRSTQSPKRPIKTAKCEGEPGTTHTFMRPA